MIALICNGKVIRFANNLMIPEIGVQGWKRVIVPANDFFDETVKNLEPDEVIEIEPHRIFEYLDDEDLHKIEITKLPTIGEIWYSITVWIDGEDYIIFPDPDEVLLVLGDGKGDVFPIDYVDFTHIEGTDENQEYTSYWKATYIPKVDSLESYYGRG